MDMKEAFLQLEAPLNRLSDGVSAVLAFCLALDQENHDLAGGLWAVWRYLDQQSAAVRERYYSGLEQLKA